MAQARSPLLEKALESFESGEDVRFVNFRYSVPANTLVQLRARSPLIGLLTHALFHFPPGCLALVDLRVDVDLIPVYPITGWISLDDATPVFKFSRGQPVKKRDYLDVWLQNRDTINPHIITVLLVLEGDVAGGRPS